MNIEILEKCISRYKEFINQYDWREQELYKFEFSNWLNEKIDLNKQDDESLLKYCIESQQNRYTMTSFRGIQFLKNSGNEKLSEFISIKDINLFKKLKDFENFEKSVFSERTMSYTAMSGWLGTILPKKFICAPSTDFKAVVEYIFEEYNSPSRGFNGFMNFQSKFKLIKQFLKKTELRWIFLNKINSYRESEKIKTWRKNDYDEADWNWLTQDLALFTHRIILNLKDTSYLNELFTNQDSLPGRTLTLINRIDRDSTIVQEIKKLYNYQCQICTLSSKSNKSKFVEGAHIKPLGGGHLGQDKKENILCLCPNHHKLFDLGQFTINDDLLLEGIDGKIKFDDSHNVDLGNIRYHREKVYTK